MFKKSQKILCIVALFICALFIINKNRKYPSKDIIDTYSRDKLVELGDFSIKLEDSFLYKKGIDGYPVVGVNFIIKNNSKEILDLSDLYYKLVLYDKFDNSYMQNMDFNNGESIYNPIYKDKDFLINPNATKDFIFYYYLSKEISNTNKFLYIDNSLYENEFKSYLDEGVLYYKVLDVGSFHEWLF